MAAFRELGLAPWLVEQARQMGLSRPTPVQASCIPPILQGECDPLAIRSPPSPIVPHRSRSRSRSRSPLFPPPLPLRP